MNLPLTEELSADIKDILSDFFDEFEIKKYGANRHFLQNREYSLTEVVHGNRFKGILLVVNMSDESQQIQRKVFDYLENNIKYRIEFLGLGLQSGTISSNGVRTTIPIRSVVSMLINKFSKKTKKPIFIFSMITTAPHY